MKEEILLSSNNPRQIESWYQATKPTFKRTFKILYPEFKETLLLALRINNDILQAKNFFRLKLKQ